MTQAIPGLTEGVQASLEELRVNLRAEMSLLAHDGEGGEDHPAFREIADALDRRLGNGYPYVEPKGWLWHPAAA